MALSNMQVFNDYVMPATLKSVDQMVNAFNEASGGAIVLSSEGFTGDFMRESFFASLSAAHRQGQDRYSQNAAVTAVDLTELKGNKVKIAGGFGPVRYEPSQMSWLSRPTKQGIALASLAFAELLIQGQLNTAVAALVAAIGNNTAVLNASTSAISYSAINGAHAKFGDASASIIANVMDGATYHKLIDANLHNNGTLFNAGNITVVDILNKRVVVTDAPALKDGTSNVNVLGLTAGAAVVGDIGDIITNVQDANGKERIETTFQADYSYTLSIKGYSWNETTGGKSPSIQAVSTGANWPKVVEFDKFTAGVMAKAALA